MGYLRWNSYKKSQCIFWVQRDNVTHYVSRDLRFSFESDDGIPLQHELRANQIPLYVLRGLSRRWGLLCMKEMDRKINKGFTMCDQLCDNTKMFDKQISTVSRGSFLQLKSFANQNHFYHRRTWKLWFIPIRTGFHSLILCEIVCFIDYSWF